MVYRLFLPPCIEDFNNSQLGFFMGHLPQVLYLY